MKPIQDWEGVFDRRRSEYEIVSFLKDRFDRRDGNNGGSDLMRIAWVQPKPLHKRDRGFGEIKTSLSERKSDGFGR